MSFRINRVYTRSGDGGHTGLVGGERVLKSDLRVCAYGDIDELNSNLGLLKEKLTPDLSRLREVVEFIQQELFDLGSELATNPGGAYEGMWRVTEAHIVVLEQLCDKFGDELPELTSFILPGGSEVAALCHISRTVCRRAERSVVKMQESSASGNKAHEVSDQAIIYLNRLSDLLFILARWCLKQEGREAPLWTKGEKRIVPLD